jgi:hypothetical protein
MEYTKFETSAKRHIESCYHILDNLTNSSAPFKKQKEDRLIFNIYYLSGYVIECSLKFAFFKAIRYDKHTAINLLKHSDGVYTYIFPKAKLRLEKSLQIHELDVLRNYLESVDKSLPHGIPFITQTITNQSHKILINKWNSEIRYSVCNAKILFPIDSHLMREYLDNVVKPIFDKLTDKR